jgi:glutamate-1-semialdehyde 2,1-aminomutase
VRELCTQHGVVLIFDEVKTGATIARGGATERFGVKPDIVTLAKATCGGYPGGSIGMTDAIGQAIADDTVVQYGTFNGNPLVMAAAEATLTKVLTADAYAELEQANDWLLGRCDEIIEQYGLPCYTQGLGAKGCVVFAPEPLREYRDYLTKVDGELSTLAWLYHMNHGVFMTPGVEEEWTLSIAHAEDDLQTFADALEAFARDLTGA